MSKRYEHVLGFALSHPWAITPGMLSVIAGVLARAMAGLETDPAQIQAALVNRKNLPQPRAGSVAVIPVYGVIAPRMNMMSDISGGTTFERLTSQLREAVANKDVKNIVLDVDSPGGTVAGGQEFANEVLRARAKKPVIAQAQFTMASAAYQLAACATEVVGAPSSRIGSVGAYMIHNDLSEALKQLGVKRTFISAGDGKVDGNETGPLSESALSRMQAAIDEAYGAFVATVVKGRGAGVSTEMVKNDWKAHVYSAKEALSLGMIDRIATLDETIARLLSGSGDPADQQAARTFTSVHDTAQEPATATAQDRASEAELQRRVLDLAL